MPSKRQDELTEIVEKTLDANPGLREALDVFQISHEAYARAIAATQHVVITTSSSTTMAEETGGNMGRGRTRNRKTRKTAN